MGARQLVAVGFRLFAIWLCVSALQFTAMLATVRSMEQMGGDTSWLGLLLVGVCVGVALLVWALSGPVARGLMSGLIGTSEPRFAPRDMVAVGCILMGLWWLKGAVFPLGVLWVQAVRASSETGQSALAWLGIRGEILAGQDAAQIVVAAFFISRPYRIASWILRHAPVVPEANHEPFHLLLQCARELGVRQIARPDIIDELVMLLATHPEATDRLPELEALLSHGANPLTRSAAARAIAKLGPAAAARAKDAVSAQLAGEATPEVVLDLRTLVALADGPSG